MNRLISNGLKSVVVFLIRLYQRFISPLLSNSCRFSPTCSHYMIEVIQKKGVFIGGFWGIFRILRCNPLSRGGYDPVK